MSRGERTPEAAEVAAAYFREDELAGAINVSIPRHRLAERDDMARFGKLVQAAARRLTTILSAPGAESTAPERAARTIGPVDATPGGSAERRSIVRVAAAFDALARCPAAGLSVEKLAEEISTGRTTAAQLLRALGALGVARPIGDDRYEPGPELLAW
jgi:DNA-binding IclR family transcriptional regulator